MKPLIALLVLLLSSDGLAQILGRIPQIDNMPCVKDGYGYQDPDVKHVNGGYVLNAGTCHRSCTLFPECYAFTWYKSSKECWFYKNGLELQEVPGAVGGPWECATTTAGSDVAESATTTAGVEQAPAGPAPSDDAGSQEATMAVTSTAADIAELGDAESATSAAGGAVAEVAKVAEDVEGVEEEEHVAAPGAGVTAALAPAAQLETGDEGSLPSTAPSAGADVIPAVADRMPAGIAESSTLANSSQANYTGSVSQRGTEEEEEPGNHRGGAWYMVVLIVALIGVLGAVIFGCLMRALNPDEEEEEQEEEEEKEHRGRRGRRKGMSTRKVELDYGQVAVDVTDSHQDGEEVVDSAKLIDNEQAVGRDYGELVSERPPPSSSVDTSSLGSTSSFTSWPQAPTRGLMPPPLLSPLIQPPQLLSPLPAAPTPFTLSAPWQSASTSSLPPPVVFSGSRAASFAHLQSPPSPFPVQALPTSLAAMVPPSPVLAPRPAADVFDMLDTNRDGVLSRSELAVMFQ